MKPLQFTIPVTAGKTVTVQEDRLPRFYHYLHRHKEAQLVWIKNGKGTLIADNSMHLFQNNDIFLIAPNQAHVFKDEVNKTEGIHSLSLYFDVEGTHMQGLLHLPELRKPEAFFREYRGGFKLSNRFFREVSVKMSKIQQSKNIEQLTHFLGLLEFFAKMNPKPVPLTEPVKGLITEGEGLRMGNIYNYVTKHYQREITLDEISAETHLTPQAFCRYFKKHTGVTFITFLNQLRINEACKKLISGNFDNISTIAYGCGFNSITNFNRVFKSIAGDSPKDYLSKYLKNVNI